MELIVAKSFPAISLTILLSENKPVVANRVAAMLKIAMATQLAASFWIRVIFLLVSLAFIFNLYGKRTIRAVMSEVMIL